MGSREASPGPPGQNLSLSPPAAAAAAAPAAPTQRIRPSTQSEWLCYTVLHHANLLQYYNTFIAQGGDDVPQLMDAPEEEFLEIMALVGMAQKPLHVRRLQKALQEFSMNPAHFNLISVQHQASAHSAVPGLFSSAAVLPSFPPPAHPTHLSDIALPRPSAALLHRRQLASPQRRPHTSPRPPTVSSAEPPAAVTLPSTSTPLPVVVSQQLTPNPPPNGARGSSLTPTALISALPEGDNSGGGGARSEGGGEATSEFDFGSEGSMGPSPGLSEDQVAKLKECSEKLIAQVPLFEPKLIQNKKKISPALLAGPHQDRRQDEYRRYAAIYGRFDAKRKADKPLTLHEVSVNEAAAQICMLRPALLTRRDELFPLARQVVKDAGYNYAKPLGHKRAGDSDSDYPGPSRKRGTPQESGGSSGEPSPSPPAPRLRPPPPIPAAGLFLPSHGLTHGAAAFLAKYRGLSRSELGTRLSAVKAGFSGVLEKQKLAERRMLGATDVSVCFSNSAELHSLTRQQLELSNEQTALEVLLRESLLPAALFPVASAAFVPSSVPTSAAFVPAATATATAVLCPVPKIPKEEPPSEPGVESDGDDESTGDVEVGDAPQPQPPSSSAPLRITRLASKRERLQHKEVD